MSIRYVLPGRKNQLLDGRYILSSEYRPEVYKKYFHEFHIREGFRYIPIYVSISDRSVTGLTTILKDLSLTNNKQNKPVAELTLKDLNGELQYNDQPPPTPMVARCMYLYTTPVEKYAPDDLRLMIVQSFGLPYLIPLALDILKMNLFTETLYFPGDLLEAVTKIPVAFWKDHELLKNEFIQITRGKDKFLRQHSINIPVHLQ